MLVFDYEREMCWMFDFSELVMEQLVVHRVGNKLREEGIVVSPNEYCFTDGNVEELLLKYFLSAFREKVFYKFFHETNLHLNEVYMYASNVFVDRQRFYEQSVNILKHLYEQSTHPQIKGGEFYMAYFSGCLVNQQKVAAIGIFKTENKENYLKVSNGKTGFSIDADKGINIKKLDKGSIIFNIESVDGYRVAIVDNVNKGENEARYWKNDFLRLTNVEDEYFHTQNCLNACRDFAENVYGAVYNASKKDQVMFVNEAMAYFQQNNQFQLDDFVENVVKQPELREEFKEHKQIYDLNQGINPAENFTISEQAVKTAKRKLKNLIKLDNAIEIRIKTPLSDDEQPQFIERGYDDNKKMHFYKIYFQEEE